MNIADCDAEDAPALPSMIRITLVDDSGEGDSAYFDPATLPDIMRRFDRQKDVRGRTYRSLATDPKSWAQLCAIAIEGRKTSREAALLLALWCYCRHPRNINLADKLHGLLAEHDRACLMVVHDRRTKNVLAAAAPGFDREAVETLKALVGAEVPEGFSFATTGSGDGQRSC